MTPVDVISIVVTIKDEEMNDSIQFDDNNELDEIIALGGAHLERMSKEEWFLRLLNTDGSENLISFSGKIIRHEAVEL